MLSRVADSIYWMCRYIERAENIARFINVNWHIMLDAKAQATELQWEPLIKVTADEKYFKSRYDVASRENVVAFLVFDKTYPNSIISCLAAARENARSIREMIPEAMWQQVNTFHHMVQDASKDPGVLSEPHEFLTDVVRASNEFVGLTITTMTHDEGWHFCRMGRMLERADKTSRVLDVKYFYLLPSIQEVGSPLDYLQWSSLLRSTSALQAYRQMHGTIAPREVVGMLVLDRTFPRAVRYCVDRTLDSLHGISGCGPGSYANQAERVCGQLSADLTYINADDVMAQGVHEYVDALQTKFNEIGSAIYTTFFERAGTTVSIQSAAQ